MSSLDICRPTCRPAEVVGEVRRRYTLQTLVDEKGELIVNPLRYFEPVKLAEERGDVVEPRRGKHHPAEELITDCNRSSWHSGMPTSDPLP